MREDGDKWHSGTAITEIALSLRSRELNSAPSHSIIVAYFLLGPGRLCRAVVSGQVITLIRQ